MRIALRRLLSELRRRKVLRVAAAYAVAAFVVLQVADLIIEPLRLPSWFMTVLVVLAVLAFPLTLVLAWAFDLTSEGVKRTEPVAEPASATASPGSGSRHAAGYVGLGVLVALVGFGGYAALDDDAGRGASAKPDSVAAIAVLPFENLSGDPENEYFSDGITDDVIVQLATIGELSVIGRTSVMRYKGTTLGTGEIARELGVGHVLAGSVRRDGHRVRVVAQLLDGHTERPVWAKTYDRELNDIFAIQSELAQAIAGALEATLTEDQRERLEKRPTENIEAYDAYLRAVALDKTYRDENEAAIALLRHAMRLDPGFAGAHAELAFAYANRVEAHGFAAEWADSAVTVARRAAALDSMLPAAYHAMGSGLAMQGRLREAVRAIRRAVEVNPSDGEAMNGIAVWESALGRYDEALRWGLRGIPLSPKSPWLHNAVGFISAEVGDIEAAERYLRQALEIHSDFAWAFVNLAELEAARGHSAAARGWIERLLERDPDHVIGVWTAGTVAASAGDWAAAARHYDRAYHLAPETRGSTGAISLRSYLAQALLRTDERARGEALLHTALVRAREEIEGGSEFPGLRVEVAAIHAARGDADEAMRWMQAAYDAGWRSYWTGDMPLLEPLHDDPRFIALLARISEDCAAMRRRLASAR